jgi:hypothetical protein
MEKLQLRRRKMLSKLSPVGTAESRSTHPISNIVAWERKPSLCHPDRREAEWRDLVCALTALFDSPLHAG